MNETKTTVINCLESYVKKNEKDEKSIISGSLLESPYMLGYFEAKDILRLKQALNEIREYCNFQIKDNETLIERLEGTNSFRIGNAKSMITEFKNILQIIDKYMKEDD